MLSRELEVSLNLAFKDARAQRHELMSVEHLLLALLDNTAAVTVLNACNADVEKLKQSLATFISETTPIIPEDQDGRETQPTLGFQRVLQRAVFHVQSSGKKEVTGANVLVAIFAERESNAAYFLQEQDMTRYDAVNFIAHGVAKDPAYGEHRPVKGANEDEAQAQPGQAPEAEQKDSALAKYCVDLNVKAKGDVDVDYHHTVEDVGLVLGQAFKEALGDKLGIRRYGFFILPMDETLARCAVDLSNRPMMVYQVEITNYMVKDFNIALVREFFQGLANSLGCNLHLKLEYGDEPHHIAEALFKAFARALREALEVDPRQGGRVPSTKGTLA